MSEDNNIENSNNEMDFGQMEKMMNMVKMVKSFADSGMLNSLLPQQENKKESAENLTVAVKEEPKVYSVPFDDELQTPTIKTIKAAIPYLDFKYQRNIGIIVKLIEMDRLFKKYSDLEISSQSIDKDAKRKMLNAIRPQLDQRNQQVMDMFFKFIEIKNIVEVLENGKQ